MDLPPPIIILERAGGVISRTDRLESTPYFVCCSAILQTQAVLMLLYRNQSSAYMTVSDNSKSTRAGAELLALSSFVSHQCLASRALE
jgi:hypothetical protein